MSAVIPSGSRAAGSAPSGLSRPALVLFVVLSLLTGLAYPLLVTALAQLVFPVAANGSLVVQDGKVVGSSLIGQPFSDPKHFWSRPSATSPMPNNAGASGGSNLGPSNPALADAVKARIDALREADRGPAGGSAGPGDAAPVPVDLVTASAGGLDPHISRAAADAQVRRVAGARGVAEADVRALVQAHTEGRLLGFIGEPRVNVLALNLALDARKP
jgi:K+-transporting ATPase ATPase C chain